MQVYVCRMWLTISVSSSAAQAAFDLRWTREIERRWSVIAVLYDPNSTSAQNEAALRTRLDTEFVSAYGGPGGWLSQDVAGYASARTPLFPASTWSIGSGGLHEGHQPVMVNRSTGGPVQWGFTYQGSGGALAYVTVHCAWSLVDAS